MPAATVDATTAVSVLDPAPGAAIVAGNSVTATPLGAPETLNVMAALKDPLRVVVTDRLLLAPAATSSDEADSERLSDGAFTTVSETGAECEMAPLVPSAFTV